MKKNLLLVVPLIMLSACNGSDNNNNVSQSTFDAVNVELDNTKAALAKAEREKAELANDKTQLQVTLDAKLNELPAAIAKLDQSEKKVADLETVRDDAKKKSDLLSGALMEATKTRTITIRRSKRAN